MIAAVKDIEYHLPGETLSNEELEERFPHWTKDRIEEKTGIVTRHLASARECSSDLGVAAAEKLFLRSPASREDIDFLLFCTQSPDYFLPTSACLMQDRLGIPRGAGAFDFNLGCSGFVYGLSIAKGLIESGQARNVLLITAETYSKFIDPSDKSVSTLFGDAGAATLIAGIAGSGHSAPSIGPFIFGTDGRGAGNLMVCAGGMRGMASSKGDPDGDEAFRGMESIDAPRLHMNGPEIFTFCLQAVPECVHELLKKADRFLEDVDLFVFHQANKYVLDHLRRKLRIPEEKFLLAMSHCGNTVSASIPIALKHALDQGRLKPGHIVMLVGFGVGYSWAGTLIRWP
jgi:3-oxoacyl-[acyl-carrier-protein] synthase-3